MNYIWVTTQKAMLHYFPNPPVAVSFLQNTHRHLFKFKIWIEVFHNERELEFLLFQDFIEKTLDHLNSRGAVIGESLVSTYSCETISDAIHSAIKEAYCTQRDRKIRIEVSEDGENGSYKEY